MIMGRLRKPAGRYITDASDDYLKRFSSVVVGSVGSTYDPLLERLIGQKIVVELVEGEESHEHVGILKNYSADFYELLDVQYPQRQSVPLAENGEVSAKHLKVSTEEGVVRVTNERDQPLLLQSMQIGEQEEMLNVVVDGNDTVELNLEETGQPLSLTVKVVRELDMVVPRRRCIVRHRAERYEPSVIPEIIFDIGVMLRGTSIEDVKEVRLRQRLEKNPHSALLASNLGVMLMQRGQYEEATSWLEKAYRARYSLPDNGRRTLMLLHELRRRKAKASEQIEADVQEVVPAAPPSVQDDSGALLVNEKAQPLPGRR